MNIWSCDFPFEMDEGCISRRHTERKKNSGKRTGFTNTARLTLCIADTLFVTSRVTRVIQLFAPAKREVFGQNTISETDTKELKVLQATRLNEHSACVICLVLAELLYPEICRTVRSFGRRKQRQRRNMPLTSLMRINVVTTASVTICKSGTACKRSKLHHQIQSVVQTVSSTLRSPD